MKSAGDARTDAIDAIHRQFDPEIDKLAAEAGAQERSAEAGRAQLEQELPLREEAARKELDELRAQIDGLRREFGNGSAEYQRALARFAEAEEAYLVRHFLHELAVDFQEFGGKADQEERERRQADFILSAIFASSSRLQAAQVGQFGGGQIYARPFEPRQLSQTAREEPIDFGPLEAGRQQHIAAGNAVEQGEATLERQQANIETSEERHRLSTERVAAQMEAQARELGRQVKYAESSAAAIRDRAGDLEQERDKRIAALPPTST